MFIVYVNNGMHSTPYLSALLHMGNERQPLLLREGASWFTDKERGRRGPLTHSGPSSLGNRQLSTRGEALRTAALGGGRPCLCIGVRREFKARVFDATRTRRPALETLSLNSRWNGVVWSLESYVP